jgi:hypothetical protein
MALRDWSLFLSQVNTLLERLSPNRQEAKSSSASEEIALPLLELQEEQFFYRVIEHAADESVKDGEALDVKLSALLAAQAAITAIFLDKGWPYFWAALTFSILTIFSIVSLRLRSYQRAPKAALFAVDYLQNPRATRSQVIADKVDAISHNESLLARRARSFTLLLIATILALLVFLGMDGYNGIKHGHPGKTQTAVGHREPGPL